jgi:hypothetical protein
MARPIQLHRYRFTTPLAGHCPIIHVPTALVNQALGSGLIPDVLRYSLLFAYGEMFMQAAKEAIVPDGLVPPSPDDDEYVWVYAGGNLTWIGNGHRLKRIFDEQAYAYKNHPESRNKRGDGGWSKSLAQCEQALNWMVRYKWLVKEPY